MADTSPADEAVASSPSRGKSPRGSPALNQDQTSLDIVNSSSPPRESTPPLTSSRDLDSPPPSPGILNHLFCEINLPPPPAKKNEIT